MWGHPLWSPVQLLMDLDEVGHPAAKPLVLQSWEKNPGLLWTYLQITETIFIDILLIKMKSLFYTLTPKGQFL